MWDGLFPTDYDDMLELTDAHLSSLLAGVKHYNVTVPLPEVLQRWVLRGVYTEHEFLVGRHKFCVVKHKVFCRPTKFLSANTNCV
jgi:hypothetical protein